MESAAIQRIIAAISKADRNRESRPAAADVEALANIVRTDQAVLQRLQAALGDLPEDTGQFLIRICEIEPALGFSSHSSIIAGHILAHAMTSMSHQQKSDVLNAVVTDQIRFFPLLRCLVPVFARVALEADYVTPWLLAAYERIRTDLAQGSFWSAIEEWALHDPVQALGGLRMIIGLDDLNDSKIAIAATILGNLRVAWERGQVNEAGKEFAETLLASGDVNLRLIYHRSWISTGWARGLSAEEFSATLKRMGDGTVQEREEAFNFLRCLLPDAKTASASREAGLSWLTARVQSSSSDQAKHWVVTIVHKLFPQQLADGTQLRGLWNLLIAAQPIDTQNAGTWRDIEHLLVDLVAADREEFKRLLGMLIHANEAATKHYFGSVNTFQYLYSELSRLALQDFYAEMFFSPERVERALAFAMFDRMPFDRFPEGMLASKDDDEIALCVFESRLHHLDAVQVSTLFMMLTERAESGAKPLTDLFRNELLYQAKNFPSAVLERLSEIETPSPPVASVVADANRYFDQLERTHGSAIKAMQIPGWRRAAFRQSARQKREIDDKSDESSSLLGLFHKSYLLYGSDGFRYSRDGELGELAKMQTMSAEMQLPRMLMIDPEGNALRRRESIHATKALSVKISGNKTSDT